jgi:hypothetical protein
VNKIQEKLNSIILPDVNFAGASLDEVLDFIRQRSRELDPAKEGINIVSKVPKPKVSEAGGPPPWEHLLNRKISLNLQQVPLSALLDFISKTTSTSYRTTEYALIVSLQEWQGLETRNFRIPATVFERELDQRDFGGAAVADPFGVAEDPFAEEGNPGAITRSGITAKNWLQIQGVDFPPGSSAFYIKAAGTLNIRNTPMELEFVERIVDSLNQSPSRRGMRKADAERLALLKKTLKETMIPLVDLTDATLEEALEFVRMTTGKKGELNPIQFVYRVDAKKPTVTLKLTNVPVGIAIKHIVDLAGNRSVVTPYGIEVARPHQEGGDLQVASFQLSPENLKKIHASMANPPEQFPISDTLRQIGMEFPSGSVAFWNSTTGDLIVRQTDTNLSQLASLLEGLTPPGEK